MIIDALLGLLISFLNLVFSYFTTQADVPISNFLTASITYAAGLYSAMNFIFPFSTLFSIIIFDLTFEGIYFIYKLIKWAYNKVPGVN